MVIDMHFFSKTYLSKITFRKNSLRPFNYEFYNVMRENFEQYLHDCVADLQIYLLVRILSRIQITTLEINQLFPDFDST